MGVPPNHPFNPIFHYKPSIYGVPHLWKPHSMTLNPHSYRLSNHTSVASLLSRRLVTQATLVRWSDLSTQRRQQSAYFPGKET